MIPHDGAKLVELNTTTNHSVSVNVHLLTYVELSNTEISPRLDDAQINKSYSMLVAVRRWKTHDLHKGLLFFPPSNQCVCMKSF